MAVLKYRYGEFAAILGKAFYIQMGHFAKNQPLGAF
jgi:hypothetical protein